MGGGTGDAGRDGVDDLRSRTVRGALWSFAQTWGVRLVTTVLFVVLTRLLGAESMGLMALAVFFVELGRVLVDQGFAQAVVQRRDLDDLDLSTAFWTAVGLGAVLAVVGFAGAPVLAALLGDGRLEPYLRVMSMAFLLAGAGSVPLGLLQRELRFRAIATQRVVSTVVGGVVALVLALSGAGVWSLVAMHVVTAAVGTVLLLGAARWRPVPRWSSDRLRSLRSFVVSVMGLQALDFLSNNGDNLVVGHVLGPTVLGYYAAAYRVLSTASEVLGSAVATVAFPAFSRIADDRDRMVRAFLQGTRLMALVAVPCFAGLAVVGPDVVALLFGDAFAPAAPMLQVLALLGALGITGWFFRPALLAAGRPRTELLLAVVGLSVKLAAFLALARAGVVAALWGQFVAGLVVMVWFVRVAGRGIGFSVARHFAGLALPLLAATAMGAVAWSCHAGLAGWAPLPRLVTTAVTGAFVYVAIVWLRAGPELRALVRRAAAPHAAGPAPDEPGAGRPATPSPDLRGAAA